ncbi:MAG: bifunctional oligoribonuclease/PAP phosphatase NrnA [Cyclobacteriaceae bacterium]
MQNFESFKEFLATPQRIVITTHQNPDADALGSSLGLYNYLIKKGHQVTVITPTTYPDFLNWMKGNEHVLVYTEMESADVTKLIDEATAIFCLDFSSLSRINDLGELVREAKTTKVLIDHHLNPEDFADYTLWSTDAAATAELIFDLISMFNDVSLIDTEIAESLYAGIMTDTGSFRHPSTSAKVHRIVAELVDCGANVNRVSKLIYDNNSLNRIRFVGFALSNRLFIKEEMKLAYLRISKEDMAQFDLKSGDTEGLVNYALSIKGINIAAILMEKDGLVKMSFRSIGDFSVNDFAAQNFNGGGHKNAAGGASKESLEETEKKFLEAITHSQKQLNYEF